MRTVDRTPVPLPPHLSHGKPYIYKMYRCRCEPCAAANARMRSKTRPLADVRPAQPSTRPTCRALGCSTRTDGADWCPPHARALEKIRQRVSAGRASYSVSA